MFTARLLHTSLQGVRLKPELPDRLQNEVTDMNKLHPVDLKSMSHTVQLGSSVRTRVGSVFFWGTVGFDQDYQKRER